jgi:hypothetical protein
MNPNTTLEEFLRGTIRVVQTTTKVYPSSEADKAISRTPYIQLTLS